jgi:nanoRNase/pAp phosphatase (c-di-AMP/oligoRNAs hydrolase)
VFTIAQVGELVSDQLNSILKMERDVDLAVGIQFLLDENKFVCSLRSLNKTDCSAIAKEFGGGGHPNAAGFALDLNYLKDFLSSFVVLDKALEAITQ